MGFTEYTFDKARRIITEKGLAVDEYALDIAATGLEAEGFTQEQFDTLVGIHCDIMRISFNRNRYGLWTRIKVAAYWLGFGRDI